MNKKKGIISCLMWQISIIDFSCPDISTWKSWRFCQQGAWNPTPKRKKRRPKFLRNIFPKGVSRAWKSLHFRIGGSVSSAMSNNSIFFGPTVKFKWDTIFSFFSIAQRTASQVPFWGWSTANFWDHLLLLILGPSHLHWTHPSPFPAHYWVGPSICLAPDLVKKQVWHLQAERKNLLPVLVSLRHQLLLTWNLTITSAPQILLKLHLLLHRLPPAALAWNAVARPPSPPRLCLGRKSRLRPPIDPSEAQLSPQTPAHNEPLSSHQSLKLGECRSFPLLTNSKYLRRKFSPPMTFVDSMTLILGKTSLASSLLSLNQFVTRKFQTLVINRTLSTASSQFSILLFSGSKKSLRFSKLHGTVISLTEPGMVDWLKPAIPWCYASFPSNFNRPPSRSFLISRIVLEILAESIMAPVTRPILLLGYIALRDWD